MGFSGGTFRREERLVMVKSASEELAEPRGAELAVLDDPVVGPGLPKPS